MTSRRGLLTAAAGVVFCGCGGALAQTRHGPVMVRGKRIKTVDVHSHCIFREAMTIAGDRAPPIAKINNADQAFLGVDERLKAMDAMAIDMEMLSINPFWYGTTATWPRRS